MDAGTILRAVSLGLTLALLAQVGCRDGDVGDGDELALVTSRVSVRMYGVEAHGDSLNAALSADGRYVAFDSDAEDLIPGDSNGHRDIFVKDRSSGAVENLTFDPGAATAYLYGISYYLAAAFNPSISADGRYVAFQSKGQYAGGTFPPQVWTTNNVFVRDRATGTTVAVGSNVDPWPDADCTEASLSADGRYVAFVSGASNLGFTNASKIPQIYVADLSVSPPTLTLVSHASGSATLVCNGACYTPQMSSDSQSVVFASQATNLNGGDADVKADVFLGTPGGTDCQLVSVTGPGPTPTKGDDISFMPAVSGDGRFVAFYTYANNLIPGVSQMYPMIVIRDRQQGETSLVSRDVATVSIMQPSGDRVGISDDGQIVAFTSINRQAMVWDRSGGARVASLNVSGAQADLPCFKATLSADGRWAAWHTDSANLIAVDENGKNDIYVRGPLR